MTTPKHTAPAKAQPSPRRKATSARQARSPAHAAATEAPGPTPMDAVSEAIVTLKDPAERTELTSLWETFLADWMADAEAQTSQPAAAADTHDAPVRSIEISHILEAVEDQRSKLLNVLGGIQCVRVATRHGLPYEAETPELEGAIDLLHDEVQRIVTALEDSELRRAAGEPHERGEEGQFTDDSPDRTPLPGLPPALPCPFCGHHEYIMLSETKKSPEPHYRAQCDHCGADAPGGATLADAADEWNTRGRLREAPEEPRA